MRKNAQDQQVRSLILENSVVPPAHAQRVFVKYITLAARGLEEPQNSQELLTVSVDLTKFVGPLPFSV